MGGGEKSCSDEADDRQQVAEIAAYKVCPVEVGPLARLEAGPEEASENLDGGQQEAGRARQLVRPGVVCFGVHVGEYYGYHCAKPGYEHERPVEGEPDGQSADLGLEPLVLVVAREHDREGDKARPNGDHERSVNPDENVGAERLDMAGLRQTDGRHRAHSVRVYAFCCELWLRWLVFTNLIHHLIHRENTYPRRLHRSHLLPTGCGSFCSPNPRGDLSSCHCWPRN